MECIFCKIVEGKRSSLKIYEDEKVIAFLDINPRVEGHTLVVPKRHVESLEELKEEDAVYVLRAIKNVLKILISKLNAEGYNVVVNRGRIAGQEIPHLHLHIFPRKRGDGGLFSFKEIDLHEVYKKIVE
jgi:histidine triad (HIT) family protein